MRIISILCLALLSGCEKEEIKRALQNDKVNNLAEQVIDIAEDKLEKETGIKVDIQLPEKENAPKEISKQKRIEI